VLLEDNRALDDALQKADIKRVQSSIDRAHSELILIDHRIDEIAVQQLSSIEVDGAPMRAQKLAELVVSGQATCFFRLAPRSKARFSKPNQADI
jgi:ABC-type thiamine transport system ATPase subunit